MARVDIILLCSDFSKNPVNFFCPPGVKPTIIKGQINGISLKSNGYILTITTANKEIYHLLVKAEIFPKIFGTVELVKLQNKTIQAILPNPVNNKSQGIITQASQVKIVP